MHPGAINEDGQEGPHDRHKLRENVADLIGHRRGEAGTSEKMPSRRLPGSHDRGEDRLRSTQTSVGRMGGNKTESGSDSTGQARLLV